MLHSCVTATRKVGNVVNNGVLRARTQAVFDNEEHAEQRGQFTGLGKKRIQAKPYVVPCFVALPENHQGVDGSAGANAGTTGRGTAREASGRAGRSGRSAIEALYAHVIQRGSMGR
jgi:hypothetical protein